MKTTREQEAERIITSGSYPLPQALTIAEVVEQIASQTTFACDELPPDITSREQ